VLDHSNGLIQENYFLQPGFIYVAVRPTVISTVLGSCVSVCIFDRKRRVGGMNHFQLPYTQERHLSTARYGNVATSALIYMMINHGSKIKNLEAQIYGGAYDPALSPKNVGNENIRVARRILMKKRIRIASEDVGGHRGRKIIFNTGTYEIAILKVERLRKEDWYPYEEAYR